MLILNPTTRFSVLGSLNGPGLERSLCAFDSLGYINRDHGIVCFGRERACNGDTDDCGFFGHGNPQVLAGSVGCALGDRDDPTQAVVGRRTRCFGGARPIVKPLAAAFAQMPLRH